MQPQEGKYLPVKHCIENTDGWKIRSDIASLLLEKNIINKPTFGTVNLAKLLKRMNDDERIESFDRVSYY